MIGRKIRHRTGEYDEHGHCTFHGFVPNTQLNKNLVPALAIIERPDGMVEYWDAEYVIFVDSETKYREALNGTTSTAIA